MPRLRFFFLAPFFLLFTHSASAVESITVMADPSLDIAISAIARDYSRRSSVVITTSYLPPKLQQAQITEGAAADVLITHLASWIDELKTQGLIDVYSPAVVAKNYLALIGPADSPLEIDWSKKFPAAKIIGLLGGEPGFAIGNPETLADGIYAKEALRSLGAAESLEPYILYVKRLDEIFELITQQKAYGIIFLSNTLEQPGVHVIGVLPETLHRAIQYQAVVVAGENMRQARKFLDYLKSDSAQKIFRDNGL